MIELSVLIPCSDASFLAECLSSVHAIKATKEILVYLNRMRKEDQDVISDSFSNIKFYKEEPPLKDLAEIRDFLYEESKGKYILFFDADDVVIPPILKRIIKIMEDNSRVGVVFSHKIHRRWESYWETPAWNDIPIAIPFQLSTYYLNYHFQTGCAVWRKDFLERVIANSGGELWKGVGSPAEYHLLDRTLDCIWEDKSENSYIYELIPEYSVYYRVSWSPDQITSKLDRKSRTFERHAEQFAKLFPEEKDQLERAWGFKRRQREFKQKRQERLNEGRLKEQEILERYATRIEGSEAEL
jgi:glycosyltransferase involved in cell wall biosynthesis